MSEGKTERELSVDYYCERVKMAIIGDPAISPDDGLKALAWLKLYIAKLTSEYKALELGAMGLAQKVRRG